MQLQHKGLAHEGVSPKGPAKLDDPGTMVEHSGKPHGRDVFVKQVTPVPAFVGPRAPHGLDVVFCQGVPVLQLLAGKDQAMLIRRNALLILDLSLDVVDSVGSLDIQGDDPSGQSLDKDLPTVSSISQAGHT